MNRNIFCETSGGNTGLPSCGITPGKLAGIFLVREKTTLTLDELADLGTTLKEKAALANLNQRFFPIYGVDEDEDASEDATITSSSRGYSEKTAPGSIQYSLSFHLDTCRAKQLAKWDGFQGYCFLADDNGNFWGRRNEDGTLTAFKLSNLIMNLRPFKAGSDIRYNVMTINLGAPSKAFWDSLDAEKYHFDITDVVAIQDLAIRKVDATTFTAELTCGGGSVYDQYKTVIANSTAWSAINAVTGVAIPIATVAENDAKGGYDITFTTPPVAGDKVTISLKLEGLSGIEGTK